jgi:hypothetical protein
MRVLVAILALFPILAAAQNLGTYQITSGTISGDGSGEISGSGVTAELYAAPELLSSPTENYFQGGSPPLSFCFGCGLPGTDDAVGAISGFQSSDPTGNLAQIFGEEGYMESGTLTVSSMNVTGAGTYTAKFALSAQIDLAAPGSTTPTNYVDLIGNGTVTLDVGAPTCYVPGFCPVPIESVTYTFAPELDPASLGGALTLLVGGVMVLRGPRLHAR